MQEVRVKAGRCPEPSIGILDSQTVKTAVESGVSCGYDTGKKTKGHKRHAVVDAMELLLALTVHDADLQDRDGAQNVLVRLFKPFQDLVKIFAASGYTGEELVNGVQKHFAELEAGLSASVSTACNGYRIVRKLPEPVGFVVHAKQ